MPRIAAALTLVTTLALAGCNEMLPPEMLVPPTAAAQASLNAQAVAVTQAMTGSTAVPAAATSSCQAAASVAGNPMSSPAAREGALATLRGC